VPEYLTPGVYFEFRDTAPPVIRRVRTDIAGFVGLAERGPLNQAVQIDSWRQFQGIFGNFVSYSFLAYAIKGYFENGGRTCFIVRIAGNTAARATQKLKNSTGGDVLEIFALNEGAWGNEIEIALTNVRKDTITFSLRITRRGVDPEYFSNLSINPEKDNYFVEVINNGNERIPRSRWVEVKDLLTPGTPISENLLPDAQKSDLNRGLGFLKGGKDGIASLAREDFLGSSNLFSNDKKGLSVLDKVEQVGIICIPDLHIQPAILPPKPPPSPKPPSDPCLDQVLPPVSTPVEESSPEQPPIFTPQQILSWQRAMIEHCERLQNRVAILDGATFATPDEILQKWRLELDSERGFAALYYPWIKVVDPLKINNSPVRAVPPCGHIAGIYARTDFTVGVHKAPANAEIIWAEDVTVEINDGEQAILNPPGVNCLRAFPGRGIQVYGARTISSNPDWRYVNIRRLLLMIEKAVDESTQWAVFEPNDFNLRKLLILSISSFLDTLWLQGALVGDIPEEAYYVKCDETNNPPEVVDQGKLIAEIGVKPAFPAEFIVFRIGRTVEELEIVER
jgi:uncharacterized protein